VVALDTTRNLLTHYAGVRVRLRVLPDRLPEAVAPLQVTREGDSHILQLPDYEALERMLGQLRQAEIAVQDLEVMQADLEEVFVQMMRKA
jgi:ABC-2 type transport system ATP-binding protein